TDLITTPGLINLDFADVKSVMSGAGSALMGIGSARGEGRSVQAAEKAINSPLLEASMEGAHGVLLSIAGGSDLGLFEINEAASLVQESAHPDANIIFGTVIDDSLGDEVRITVIAAGFDSGMPSYKKLDPKKLDSRPVAAPTIASGQAGRIYRPSTAAPSVPISGSPPVSKTTAAPARPAAATPNQSSWQSATAGWKPSRAVPVTDDFDDDDEVDVPPFMKR
ncbi:MAG: cell division protein FtsZ, partial [Actinobacteria bacterium]|nr:cell division protein FtsZ [Actinomycetota bacterium]